MFKEKNLNSFENSKEKENLPAKMELYLLRHGESETDKTNPNRGLTAKGQEQVKNSLYLIIKNLINENNPDFNQWDDKIKQQQETTAALANIEFHLRDSGTARTKEQVLLEYDFLKKLGVNDENIYLPQSIYNYQGVTPGEKAGPGIAKRLKGVQGMDNNPEFRKKLKNQEYQKKIGATSDMMAWANTPEDEVPDNVEKRSAMEARYQKDIKVAQEVINRKIKDYPKKLVTIANSHASIATLAAAQELNIDLNKLMGKIGEMPEAQGLKYNFYGVKGKDHTTEPFGPDIERAVNKLKKN